MILHCDQRVMVELLHLEMHLHWVATLELCLVISALRAIFFLLRFSLSSVDTSYTLFLTCFCSLNRVVLSFKFCDFCCLFRPCFFLSFLHNPTVRKSGWNVSDFLARKSPVLSVSRSAFVNMLRFFTCLMMFYKLLLSMSYVFWGRGGKGASRLESHFLINCLLILKFSHHNMYEIALFVFSFFVHVCHDNSYLLSFFLGRGYTADAIVQHVGPHAVRISLSSSLYPFPSPALILCSAFLPCTRIT